MQIEKIKNYNQKMLAVFVTILVALAAIGLISLVIFLVTQLVPDRKPTTNTLLSDEKVEKLKQESLRSQIVSYGSPSLVDTSNLVYLLPVHVMTIKNPEGIEKETMKLLDISSGYESSSYGSYQSRYYSGSFNNLLVFDFINNTTTKICSNRIVGTNLSFEYFKDEILIVFTAADKDTDQDGQINSSDMNSLFIYSLKDKKLQQVNHENSTVLHFEYIEGNKDLLITFRYDRNKDHLYDNYMDPSFVMKYDYSKGTLSKIVNDDLEKEIQDIIDKN